ncbi:MAG: 50S ribosomal protein L5 [Chloroflexi bacterium]|nr:50S ribosomal protein L5 [Chloroflexota bacterium]
MQGNDRPVEGQAPRGQRRQGGQQQPRQQGGQDQGQQRPQGGPQQTRSGGGRAAGQAQPAAPQGPPAPTVPRLLQRYREEIAPTMMREFNYHVPLQAPRLEKVVLNAGLGEALTNANVIDSVGQMLATVAGQKPVVTTAKKSIAAFKLREGMRVGTMVTLRSRRMYEFMDRLLNAALPRIRDFQGVSRTAFDGRGNYTLSIREQVIFPEIDYSKIDRIRGFQVTIVTNARSDREAFRLLELMGMPFAKA